uniref:Uncharacterized protein n=1 Tax=Setaria viridis TaxID=4556 RepID=A0A4U6TXQ2_SETVI|nr:hypothetical protein SEVIR_8G249871v2 [Setaria viridis]
MHGLRRRDHRLLRRSTPCAHLASVMCLLRSGSSAVASVRKLLAWRARPCQEMLNKTYQNEAWRALPHLWRSKCMANAKKN